MALHFGDSGSGERSGHGPPDYFGRGIQLRLILLVFLLGAVILLMFEARKPANWRWLWQNGPPPADAAAEADGAQPAADEAPLGALRGNRAAEPARLQAWRAVLDGVPADQQLWLVYGLATAGRGEPRRAWPDSLAEQIDARWAEYLEDGRRAADELGPTLSADQRRAWLDRLASLEVAWSDAWQPVVERLGTHEPLEPAERRAASELLELLDQVALGRVQDDRLHHPAEQLAWFRLLDRLDDFRLVELDAAPAVQHVQLEQQPAAYRGRPVTLHGTLRLAYRLAAPPNPWGFSHYYVFWVQPPGTDQLAAAYALEPPPELTAIPDRYENGRTLRPDRPVRISGYYFKRMVYSSEGGPATAALLVARQPQFIEAPVPPAEPGGATPARVGLAVAAALFVALTVAALAWWQTRRRSLRRETLAPEPPSWDQLPAGESVEESLKRMADSGHDQPRRPA